VEEEEGCGACGALIELPSDEMVAALDWEKNMPLLYPVGAVDTMEDAERLLIAMQWCPEEIPDLLWTWWWFRRDILSYPERCTPQRRDWHRFYAPNKGCKSRLARWLVADAEYPDVVKGRSVSDEVVADLRRLLTGFAVGCWSQRWWRWCGNGGAAGVGVRVVERVKHEHVRAALSKFAVGIEDEMFELLKKVGYTSLVASRNRRYMVGALSGC